MSAAGPHTPRPGIADRLSRMVQLPTVSAERDERGPEPFEGFVTLLGELYPRTAAELTRERITDRGLLFRWPGRDGAAAPVVLMAHYDVVPVDASDAWSHPPFAGVIADGWVYGRGTLDDKGPLVVIIDAVENLLEADFVPARDVYLSFGGDEETFGSAAARIAEVFRERGLTPWLVLDEGGAVVEAPLPLLRTTAAMIGVGEKGILNLTLTARGVGGHASAPPSRTAVRRIARAVDRLGPRTFRPRLPVAVSRMLRILGDGSQGLARPLYRTLAALPPVTARVFAALGAEPAALVRTTVAATMQSGGTAVNVLPSQASASLNLRIALGESIDSTVRRVRRRIADRRVQVSVDSGDEPSPESAADNAQFALLAAALRVSHPDATAVPYVMMATTDARHFHRFSPAVYRFAPLAMNGALRATIHGVDERVEIAELERGERFHRTLLQRLQ